MSAQRTRSAVAADHRSISPNLAGVPWWAAVVIAVTGTAVGFAFDAGSARELTTVFSALYAAGCVAAVLAVRRAGVFTAVIQPPLILFCAVPGAYFLFHGAKFTGLRDLLINCGYPLIERFPLMLFTSAGVLLIGMIRWYRGMATRPATTAAAEADSDSSDDRRPGLAARLAPLFGLFSRDSATDDSADSAGKAAKPRSQRAHAVGRSAKSAKDADRQAARRPATSRSPRVRAPLDDAPEPTRRRRPTRTRDFDAPEPPRRGRLPRDPDLRGRPPREIRRDPHVRKGRPASRSSRFDPYEPIEPYEPTGPSVPPERRPRRVPNGASSATATHHPISQVRYRDSSRSDASPKEPTARPQRPRKPAAESWEYDI
ncbi:MAG: hypothetical protein JO259_14500 [Mycobacterium sp.]|nr:hypothetical protein [Mycobacterium sp.]